MAELNRRTSASHSILRISAKVAADDFTGDEFSLQQEMNSLQLHYDRFVAAHDILMDAAEPSEVGVHMNLWDDMEEHYNTSMAKLHRLISIAQTNPNPGIDGAVKQHLTSSSTMDLKLDPLPVPSFDGTLQNWLAFKDAFETLVHGQEFPEAYKLGKLREAVKGDAVALVGGMYTGGYEDVWKALKARYDNRKQLAEIHVSRFIGMKREPTESTSALLTVVDTVREAFRALTVMQLPVDQWDALAVPIITSKLPTATQQAWGMSRTSNDIPKLDDLLGFVEKRAHSLASDVLRWNAVDRNDKYVERINTNTLKHSHRLVKSNLAATAPGNCEFCNNNSHRISRCSQLLALPVAERFQKLKGSNLCFNCLRPGHATKECSSQNCRQCNGRHHTLLCRRTSSHLVSQPGTGSAAMTSTSASPAVSKPSTTQAPQNYI